MKHPAIWTAPPAFWSEQGQLSPGFHRPRLLRFADDAFMEQLFQLLEHDPRELPSLEAEPETWREPSQRAAESSPLLESAPATIANFRRILRLKSNPKIYSVVPASTAKKPLKLYQAAHKRHYLVVSHLLCQKPGLPERSINKSKRQSVSMVVRRLLPNSDTMDTTTYANGPIWNPATASFPDWMEMAWIAGNTPNWQETWQNDRLVSGEDRLGISQANYKDVNEQPRRLLMGTIPLGRRETYQGANVQTASASTTESVDQRRLLFRSQVTGPWMELLESVYGPTGEFPDSFFAYDDSGNTYPISGTNLELAEAQLRSRVQVSSWFLLLELFQFLKLYGSDTICHTLDQAPGTVPTDDHSPEANLALWLWNTKSWNNFSSLYFGVAPNLLDAIRKAGSFQDRLDNAWITQDSISVPRNDYTFPEPYQDLPDPEVTGWPNFLFLLTDPEFGTFPPSPAPPNLSNPASFYDNFSIRLNYLLELVADCLKPGTTGPDPSSAKNLPGDTREGWYVVRMVLEHPECLAEHPEILSEPTTPFQMASYYDSDAPARPIKIGLPIDPTPAGLRKFDRNTVLQLSDLMCSHASRMKRITFGNLVLSVLPWPFHKKLPRPGKGKCETGDSRGMMLVMSIPIITICALIILMIMVALLDIVFKWLPLFMFWIPVPKNKSTSDKGTV